MPPERHSSFDLRFAREGSGWCVSCTDERGGIATVPFQLALGDPGLAAQLQRLRSRGGVPGAAMTDESAAEEAAGAFGRALYAAVFHGKVGEVFQRRRAESRGSEATLSVRLGLRDAPDLAALPWEFLQDPAREQYLALSGLTPVVRDLDEGGPEPSITFEPPLRILVVIAAATGYEPLAVNKEWRLLREALAPLAQAGRLELEKLEDGRLKSLQRQVRDRHYHVVHFIGHGSFEPGRREGVLVFENDEGGGDLVSGDELGTLLSDRPQLQLVVLNACEGGRAPSDDPFSGVAQYLLRSGVRSVIAMQSAISDAAAAVLSEEFYSAIAGGQSVDTALTEARKRVHNEISKIEWATPVLYARRTASAGLGVVSVPAAPGHGAPPIEAPAEAATGDADHGPSPGPPEPEAPHLTGPRRRPLLVALLATALVLALPFGLRAVRQQRKAALEARLLETFGRMLFDAAGRNPDLTFVQPPAGEVTAALVRTLTNCVPPPLPEQIAQLPRLRLTVPEARTLLALRSNAPGTVVGWLDEPIEIRGRWVRQVLLANGEVTARSGATPTDLGAIPAP